MLQTKFKLKNQKKNKKNDESLEYSPELILLTEK